jgi:pimeloyl-ACP methyl ester carboxylesterase
MLKSIVFTIQYQPTVCKILLLLALIPIKINAQIVSCDIQITDDRELRILTPIDVINKRLEIIRAIWNTDRIPNRFDVIITSNIASPINPNPVVSRVDKIEIPTQYIVAEGSEPIRNLAYLFIPIQSNRRLIILHHGHACTFKDSQSGESGSRMEVTILALLEAGYDVLAVYMPNVTESGCNLNHCEIINTNLGCQNQLPTYGLRLFLEPTIVSLNYLLKHNSYQHIDMIGLSGGGWTTTLIAAIDDRIKYSFPVAGSTPLYYRWDSGYGDIEQFLPQLYRDIAGYPDLYVLGSYGQGRKQIQILNRYDNCCFGQWQHDPDRDYMIDMHTYEQSVKERLVKLGAPDQYNLVIEDFIQQPVHQISNYALKNVIIPELSMK